MTQWLIGLKGEQHTLELFKDYLEETDYQIIQDGSRYYLKFIDLPDDVEPAVLKDKAYRLIDFLNGIAKLYFKDFGGITLRVVVKVRDDGIKEGFGFLTLPERSTDFTLPPIHAETLNLWISVGSKDKLVERALALYGSLEHSWKNIFMVIEVVEDDLGGEDALIQTGWVLRGRLKTLKHTANSFRAIGSESRHGTDAKEPPVSPMLLNEAREIVKDILQNWLNSKANNL